MINQGEITRQLNTYIALKWMMSIKGIGRMKAIKILEDIQDFEKVARGTYQDLKEFEPQFGKPLRAILPLRDADKFENQFLQNKSMCDGILNYWDPLYPECLKEIHDPPAILYYKGNVELLSAERPKIAIVGTRVPSEYGRKYCGIIGQKLSRGGQTIVSGMAMGIDAVAHRAAIDEGQFSIGVLGCGIDQIYPKQNEKLYQRILEKGLLLSEYEKGVLPHPIHFPERNRIIAGLSHACIVIEAAKKSGSLITAEMSMDLGRDVYAMPGPIYSNKSIGCHELIRNGAFPIVSVEDLCESLIATNEGEGATLNAARVKSLETNHPVAKYLELKGEATVEEIISELKLPIADAFEILDQLITDQQIQMSGFLYHL